ncbi:SGNH/GDSL hydrolase family protein [Methylogaea oryzae]|uniref:Uncharacterized protein n=1 Tax=Methylogaea oryzae TaxID=1295382 RepID=A0A8D4VP05_9GAMM|nr:SGNH/GDSL hydrolase family protein [Methylogaea oryzae]BBL69850.1 hypothetical protein MoryE10_04560 [Methylogaea oryzae]
MGKNAGLNALLALGSILLSFIAVEAVVERFLITRTPLKFAFALSDGVGLLAQSSKKGRLPQNYIALAGDSYAQGKGDWVFEADPNSNPPYHSAHLIQQRTGRDVISFGKRAVGSMRGLVVEPAARYRFVHDHIDSDLQPPEEIWAYFYAGNDLEDNLDELQQRFLRKHTLAELSDDRAVQAFFQDWIDHRSVGPYSSLTLNTGWLLKSTYKILGNTLKPAQDAELAPQQGVAAGDINRARIGEQTVALPDGLQGPALDLDDTQFEQGVAVFQASLRAMRALFPDAKVTVVYIPSVLEAYQVVSQQVSYADKLHPPVGSAATSRLWQNSNRLCRAVQSVVEAQRVRFIDTRPAIRAAAAQRSIHGPRDWKHFNQAGYQALVDGIVGQPATACATL